MGKMAPSSEACMAAIHAHMKDHGSTNWQLVMDKYPDVPKQRFWRLVKMVKEGQPNTAHVIGATRRAKREAINAGLPAVPPPDHLMRDMSRARVNIDFMKEFGDLMQDAHLVRDWSSKINEDGKREIKNPVYFEKSVRLRVDIMDSYVRTMREVWDLQKAGDFFRVLTKIIGDADPELQRELMARLEEEAQKHRMVLDMNLTD